MPTTCMASVSRLRGRREGLFCLCDRLRPLLGGFWATPDREIARELEAAFHETQSKFRLSGEWFDLSPKQSMVILMIGFGTLLNVGAGFEPTRVDEILAAARTDYSGMP